MGADHRRARRLHRPLAAAGGARKAARAALVALAAVVAWPAVAAAQRGADYITQQDVDQGPRDSFPGILDTTTLREGQSLFSLPAFGLDYGVTDNLSVGTNALALASNLGGTPTAYARSRYRFHSSPRWQSVIEAGGGYSFGEVDGDDVTISLLMLGSNTTYVHSRLHRFTGSALVARVGNSLAEGGDAASETRFNLAALIVAATHELTPTPWFSLRTTLLFVPSVRGALDEIGATATIEIGGAQALIERNALRVLASFRVGERWLITGGGMLIAIYPYGLPWLSVAKIF